MMSSTEQRPTVSDLAKQVRSEILQSPVYRADEVKLLAQFGLALAHELDNALAELGRRVGKLEQRRTASRKG